MTTNTKLEERFEKEFLREYGEYGKTIAASKIPALIAFIATELASERAQVVKECIAALPKEHTKEAIGAASDMTFVKMKAENAYRAAALLALQKLTQEEI